MLKYGMLICYYHITINIKNLLFAMRKNIIFIIYAFHMQVAHAHYNS